MNSIFKKYICHNGGNGFLGRHVVDYFLKKITEENIIIPNLKNRFENTV